MADSMAINQVLAQMRAMRAQMPFASEVRAPSSTENVAAASQTQGVSFSKTLTNALNSVNETQQTADKMRVAFEKGDPSVDISKVMLATQKSSIAFQATVQVRNKFIDAYKEIMNMPI
ncbi:MAG TPA: flagellar hook-basal body complex protein FliE [Pseudomonadales bacterium]|nr:flagellar hook-basal body complex protein FliE [Pseudomonadales bacterium]